MQTKVLWKMPTGVIKIVNEAERLQCICDKVFKQCENETNLNSQGWPVCYIDRNSDNFWTLVSEMSVSTETIAVVYRNLMSQRCTIPKLQMVQDVVTITPELSVYIDNYSKTQILLSQSEDIVSFVGQFVRMDQNYQLYLRFEELTGSKAVKKHLTTTFVNSNNLTTEEKQKWHMISLLQIFATENFCEVDEFLGVGIPYHITFSLIELSPINNDEDVLLLKKGAQCYTEHYGKLRKDCE